MKNKNIMIGYKSVKIWVRPEDWNIFRKKCITNDTNMRKELEKFLKEFNQSVLKSSLLR